SGQTGKHGHIANWIDRRPDGSEIFANLDQERRHVSEMWLLALCDGQIKPDAMSRLHLTTNLHELTRTRESAAFRIGVYWWCLVVAPFACRQRHRKRILICKRSRGRPPPQRSGRLGSIAPP